MSSRDVRKVLGRKRTVEILEFLTGSGVRNYTEIEENINSSSDTITDSLDILIRYRLIERNKKSKKDVRYEITNRGRKFLNLVHELEDFLREDLD